jgi:hypothetical protein
MTPEERALCQKRVSDNVCARCRRPIKIGHRVSPCWIVCNPDAVNPHKLTEKGLEIGVDCEYAHIDCEDPMLEGKKASRLILPGA